MISFRRRHIQIFLFDHKKRHSFFSLVSSLIEQTLIISWDTDGMNNVAVVLIGRDHWMNSTEIDDWISACHEERNPSFDSVCCTPSRFDTTAVRRLKGRKEDKRVRKRGDGEKGFTHTWSVGSLRKSLNRRNGTSDRHHWISRSSAERVPTVKRRERSMDYIDIDIEDLQTTSRNTRRQWLSIEGWSAIRWRMLIASSTRPRSA